MLPPCTTQQASCPSAAQWAKHHSTGQWVLHCGKSAVNDTSRTGKMAARLTLSLGWQHFPPRPPLTDVCKEEGRMIFWGFSVSWVSDMNASWPAISAWRLFSDAVFQHAHAHCE